MFLFKVGPKVGDGSSLLRSDLEDNIASVLYYFCIIHVSLPIGEKH